MKQRRLGAIARAELVQMRAALIARLDREIDGGQLALLATVQSAIAAIDAAVGGADEIQRQRQCAG